MARVVLSNSMYAMLMRCQTPIKVVEARRFDQRPFTAMLRQGWVSESNGTFLVTEVGEQALYDFRHAKIVRKNPNDILGSYVQNYLRRRRGMTRAQAYGLRRAS